MQQGKRVRAIGSSDSHNPPKELDGSIFAIGLPTNFVGAKKLTQKSFFEAIRNGRVWVAEHPTKYDLTFSGATNSGRGTIGDIISVSNNGEAKLEVSGTGFPVGATVTLISRGVPRQKLSLDKPNFAFTFTANPNSNEYFRVEVRDENNKMLAFTNPIFIQVKQ